MSMNDPAPKSIKVSFLQLILLIKQYELLDYEKIIIQRYKEAELEEANFVEKNQKRKEEADKNNEVYMIPDSHKREVFLFIYYAGHGCEDGKQWFILNE